MSRLLRILLICLFLLPMTAEARQCVLPHPHPGLVRDVPPRSFFLCLLAEIRDLKRKQAELERIVPEYKRLIAELPVPYVNDNGKVSVEEGRKIGSATFILTARQTGGASSLPVDQDVMEALCAGRHRCEISLILREIGLFSAEPTSSTISGPRLFDYDARTGDWIRGDGCVGGTLRGVDGESYAGATTGGADIITEAGEGCLLADADKHRTIGAAHDLFERDHGKGLFLVAMPERRTDGRARFRCDLVIE